MCGRLRVRVPIKNPLPEVRALASLEGLDRPELVVTTPPPASPYSPGQGAEGESHAKLKMAFPALLLIAISNRAMALANASAGDIASRSAR